MYYPNYAQIDKEVKHGAHETAQDGYMLDLSVTRASAICDMAYLYVNGENSKHSIPNGKFSDAECVLWELFCKAFRTNVKED